MVEGAGVQLVAPTHLRHCLPGAVQGRRREILQEVIAPVESRPGLEAILVIEQHGIGRVGQAGKRELVGQIGRVQLLIAMRIRTVELDTKAAVPQRVLERRFQSGHYRGLPVRGRRDGELGRRSASWIEQRATGRILHRAG